ncbi:MAG TPA: hypothetical protein VFG81_20295 [Anaerolineales bacterium]|nr:hypothetical protein [Anaerolineales bacterium]
MTEPNNNTPIIKPEMVVPPSISNLSIARVRTGRFSITMHLVMSPGPPPTFHRKKAWLDVSDFARRWLPN